MSIPTPPPFTPRSSSLSPPQFRSLSTSHLHIQTHRKKCIYLLTTHSCSHFVQPFTHPTNIIHTENFVARFGGCCSSQGYRYEISGNGGERCEVCVRGKLMKGEKESSGEIRLRDERGDGLERKREGKKRDEDMSGLEQKANADEETTDHPSNKMEHDKNSEISSTPSSSLKKPRSSPNFYTHCRAGSNNGKGKQMMTYDHQRAMPKCRRPMITGRKRVSVIIEEGGECYGGGCGVFDSGWRCGRERGRKVWEELWGRLRGL